MDTKEYALLDNIENNTGFIMEKEDYKILDTEIY